MKRVASLVLAVGVCAWGAPSIAQSNDEDETFVISANRRSVPLREVGSSVSVVTADELEAQGIIFVEEALRRLPGVQASTSGGRGGQVAIRLRGEEGYRTLVLIDGIRVSDAALPQAAVNFANLTVSGIERIEVLRGPQALLYGADAIGGVINIITRRGGAREATLYAEAGSFGTYAAQGYVAGGTDHVDGAVSGNWVQADGFSAKSGDMTLRDDDGYRNLTVHGVLGFDLSEGTRIEAVARYVDSYAQFDGFPFDPDRELLTEEVAGRIALSSDDLGVGVHHRLAYSYYRSRRDDLDGGQSAQDYFGAPISRYDSGRQEVEYLANLDPVNGHGFLIGASYLAEDVETDELTQEASSFAAFAEWQAEWRPNFFTTLGGRYDMPEDFGDHFSLRATTAYLVHLIDGEETKLRASAGTGFRAPSAVERARNVSFGLPALHEETGIGFDLGIDQPLMHDRVEVSITYFDQRIEDEIRFDNVWFTGYFQSAGRSHSRGVELGLEAELAPGLMLSTNYTYTDATVNSPDAENGLPRVRRPRHITSTNLDYTGAGGRLRLNANVRTSADTEDGFREFRVDLDDYAVAGVAASYQVFDGVELTARVSNLFDEQYQEVSGFTTARRAGFVGLRMSF